MKKQLQLILSAIVMALANLTTYGQNVGVQFDDDYITYEITSTSPTPQVKIVGYDITGGTSVDILQMVKYQGTDYDVTAIGNAAFRQKGLEEVAFINTSTTPSNVTSIGVQAFQSNELTSVEIPESVTIMEQQAFDKNKLTSVNIPRNVTSIKPWTFAVNDLTEVTIPPNVEDIGFQAFAFNQNLSIVTVQRNPPTSVEEKAFQRSLFEDNENIDLIVPFGAIQAYEAAGWTGFASITYGVTTIDRIKYGIIGSSPNEATVILGNNLHPRILAEVDIDGYSHPVPVTAIGDNAFGDRSTRTIVIPASVRSIGDRAFYSHLIIRVIVNATEPPEIHPNAFQFPYRSGNINVLVPAGKAQDYIDAGWAGFKSVSSIEGQTHLNFGYLWEVTSVNPNKVRLIDFIGHPNTSTGGHVEIPSEIGFLPNSLDDDMYSVTSIGEDALKNLLSRHGIEEALTSVEIPSSVDSIGNYAFAQNQLTEVDIPDDVTHIGEAAFAQNQLTEVDIPDAVTYIGENAFLNNNITSVEIPESVTSMGEQAFAQNELTSVEISDNVTNIREGTFSDNQLTEVTIPGNVTDIGLYAFFNNPDLHLVTVEAKDPPALHKDAFSNAYREQIDLVVPADSLGRRQAYLDNGWDGFRSISYGVFTVDDIKYGITSRTEVMVVDYTGTATEVTIPETADNGEFPYAVTAIWENAFQNKELTDVGIPVSVTSIGEGAFSDNLLTAITIPSSVERIDSHAFYNNPDLDLVMVGANDPPVLDPTAFANANRHQIDLVVPTGRMQVYEDNGWGGFQSISEDGTPPRPTIDAPQSMDDLEPFTVSITFDGEVTDFGVDDIQVTNAMVSDLTGGESAYTATIAATSPCNDITIGVPANVSTGVNGVPNSAAEQASVGIVDTIAPTIVCPADVVANTADNGTGDCTATVALGSPVTDDNCSVATVVAQINGTGIDSGTYAFGIGVTTVTWTVSDGSGNTASCEQTVTVRATGDCGAALISDFNRGFSPNGDGIADTLVIEGLEHYRNNVVRIYDLSQRLLFSAHYGGPEDAWDGTDKNGMVPVGSYVCVIDYNEPGLGHEAKMIYVNY